MDWHMKIEINPVHDTSKLQLSFGLWECIWTTLHGLDIVQKMDFELPVGSLRSSNVCWMHFGHLVVLEQTMFFCIAFCNFSHEAIDYFGLHQMRRRWIDPCWPSDGLKTKSARHKTSGPTVRLAVNISSSMHSLLLVWRLVSARIR